MKLVCDGLDLCEAVFKVSRALPNKTTNPILEGIKLVAEDDTLTLSATDLELSIEKKIKAEVREDGETVVPGKFFSEFIKKLSNEKIELNLNEKNGLTIKYTDSETFIQCFNALEYPGFKKIDSNEFVGIEKKNLKTLINKSIFAVAVDDSRPILKGCLLEIGEEIKTVALDGYRLAVVRKKCGSSNFKTSIIVPARSLSEIAKFLDDSDEIVNVYLQNNYLMVDLGDCVIITRLLEGDYLNYSQILSSQFSTEITVNKNQLEDALDRASLLSKIGQNNLVKFEIKENNLCLTANSEIGNVKENVNIVLKGDALTIAFNARYFTEAFRVINDEFVKISFNSPSNPCVITPIEGNEYLYLVLPVRILN